MSIFFTTDLNAGIKCSLPVSLLTVYTSFRTRGKNIHNFSYQNVVSFKNLASHEVFNPECVFSNFGEFTPTELTR